jgi:hypothetical protein
VTRQVTRRYAFVTPRDGHGALSCPQFHWVERSFVWGALPDLAICCIFCSIGYPERPTELVRFASSSQWSWRSVSDNIMLLIILARVLILHSPDQTHAFLPLLGATPSSARRMDVVFLAVIPVELSLDRGCSPTNSG